MYTVYHIDRYENMTLLYTPQNVTGGGRTVSNPELQLELNTSGTFTATIPKENHEFSNISVMKSRIVVKDYEVIIWIGRVINVERDFWGNKKITAEGELSYFADYLEKSFTRYGAKAEAQDYIWTGTVAAFWDALISHYNTSVCGDDADHPMYMQYKDEDGKPIYQIDAALASKRIYVENRSFSSGMDMIMNEMLPQVGGYVSLSWYNVGNKWYRTLYHSATSGTKLTQKIKFGENLLDINACINGSAIYTSIVAEGPNDANGLPYTLHDFTQLDTGYSISGYGLCKDDAVALFGKIEHYEKFDTAINYTDLYNQAKAKLDSALAESMTINLKAADLSFIDRSKERFGLGCIIGCVSDPHGLNDDFILTAVRIPLDAPESEEYTLGLANPLISAQEQLNAASIDKLKKNAITVKSASKVTSQNSTTTGYINLGDELLLAYGYVSAGDVGTSVNVDIDYSNAKFSAKPILTVTAGCNLDCGITTHITSISENKAKVCIKKSSSTSKPLGLLWIAMGYPTVVRQ